MNTSFAIKTNRFWQQCQTIGFAQRNEMKHEIETDTTPRAGGSAA
jgi:hypothetical protein